jgi:hypothetical protein
MTQALQENEFALAAECLVCEIDTVQKKQSKNSFCCSAGHYTCKQLMQPCRTTSRDSEAAVAALPPFSRDSRTACSNKTTASSYTRNALFQSMDSSNFFALVSMHQHEQ